MLDDQVNHLWECLQPVKSAFICPKVLNIFFSCWIPEPRGATKKSSHLAPCLKLSCPVPSTPSRLILLHEHNSSFSKCSWKKSRNFLSYYLLQCKLSILPLIRFRVTSIRQYFRHKRNDFSISEIFLSPWKQIKRLLNARKAQ